MKDIKENWFSKFVFPIFLGFLTVYFREVLNFKPINQFFSGNSNKVIEFFNSQLHLWQIILYGIAVYIISRIYSAIFRSKSKEERKMLRAIRRSPKEHITTYTDGKLLSKFKLTVKDEEYIFEKFSVYCCNCSVSPIKMSRYAFTDFRCSCGVQIDGTIGNDIKSAIITHVESKEQ